MCGISGVIGSNKKISKEILQKMTGAIAHRGPDGDGHWINKAGNVGLGHRRLSIIDLSDDGRQPMSYCDERYQIVFNGEIYNYIELKETLLQKGFVFKSTCDTEVLLALYHEKKEKCLEDLDGMFAFAIWDEKEQRLFCARDRFGEKPFYFALHDGALFFASEMKALWAAGVPREADNRMLFNYLAYGYVYNPQNLSETFYANIRKLEAAHYFFVTPQKLQPEPQRYWNIDYGAVDENITADEAQNGFHELFYESVKRRLRSDVPVGSSLSGGLDSSLVVCVIDELNKNKTHPQATFSARFPGFAKDEGKYMQMVVDKTNVDPHFVYPDDEGLEKDFEKLFYHQEEPFGSASIYAQFCVMRLAKENNVTVLLDGQGADELLAGYHSYFFDYFRELRNQDKPLWKQELSSYSKVHPNGAATMTGKQKFKESIPNSVRVKLSQIKWKQNLRQVFDRDFLETHFHKPSIPQTSFPKSLAESLYISTSQGSLEELLRYCDRNSMAHSREVRLPFLSHKLAEYLFTLPSRFKIQNGVTKNIMRETFAGILPAEIVARQDKIGYEPPQAKWLESKIMKDRLNSANDYLLETKIVNNNFGKNMLAKNDFRLIWKVLMAEQLINN